MKKDVIYSLRMNRRQRDALKKAAKKENRTVASLLEKIINSYLKRKGFVSDTNKIMDHRWFTRKDLFIPAKILIKGALESSQTTIVVLDISLGGVLIGYPKLSEIQISLEDQSRFDLCLNLSRNEKALCLNCEASRIIDYGYGIQVGAHFVDTKESGLQKLRNYLIR